MGNTLGGGHQVGTDAVAAYNNFLRTYCLLHAEMQSTDAIENATRMWNFFTPEQQMQYAQMVPPKPRPIERPFERPFESSMGIMNECSDDFAVDDDLSPLVAVPEKVGRKINKPKLKVKTAANKRRLVIKASACRPKRLRKIAAGKRKAPNMRVKVKAASRPVKVKAGQASNRLVKVMPFNKRVKVTRSVQEPARKAFREFFKEIQQQHSDVSKRDILKKAAQAWCNMGERQRRRFFQ